MPRNKNSIANSLNDLRPDLAAEWHASLNTFPPTEATPGSHKIVWWQCRVAEDHVWQSKIQARGKQGQGCPYCSGRRPSSTNNLLDWCRSNGDFGALLMSQFNSELNSKSMSELTYGSHTKITWRCLDCSELFEISVNRRTSMRTGCPYCSGHRVSESNSLASLKPEIALEWDAEKNGTLTAEQVTSGSGRKVWWKCSVNPKHSWQMPVVSRTSQGQSCPYCSGKRVDELNSFSAKYPHLVAFFDVVRNGCTAHDIFASSQKTYWWRCAVAEDHVWKAKPASMTMENYPCPCCPPRIRQLSVTNSLKAWCLENGIRGQKILSEWDLDANTELDPEKIIYTKNRFEIAWQCSEASDHKWTSSPYERTIAGLDCPFCSKRRPSSTNNLALVYPNLLKFLHKTLNGQVDVSKISPSTHKSLWWQCPVAEDHVWEASVNQMKGGIRCGFCAGKRVSTSNSLAINFPEIASEFDLTKNHPLTPEDITFGSGKKYWWRCSINPEHSWTATASSRTGQLKTGCPECVIVPRSRREILLAHEISAFFMIDQYDHRIKTQEKVFDCDIVLRNEKVIIEYDGSFWHQNKIDVDRLKTEALRLAGWKVIRVREEPLPLLHQDDVQCSEYEPIVVLATKVLRKISSLVDTDISDIDEYESAQLPRRATDAELFIQNLLNSPDFLTEYRQRQTWDRRFHQLEEFVLGTGHADPANSLGAPRALITWVNQQRQRYADAKLPSAFILKLEGLPGWHWSQIDFRWRQQYQLLVESTNDVSDFNGLSLGNSLSSWIVNQRKLYKFGQLNDEQVELLSGLPKWSWTPNADAWSNTYEILNHYIARLGHADVPQDHIEGDVRLGTWVNKQRGRYKRGTLENERQTLLEALPGWTWSPTSSHIDSMFNALQSFISREGHAYVPATHIENGVKIGQWLNGLRVRKRRGLLDRQLENQFSQIKDFDWEPLQNQVPGNIDALTTYLREHPDKTSVRGMKFNGRRLNSIVVYLRRQYASGQLSTDIIDRLNALPNWSWSPFEDSWNQGFSSLLTYVEREKTSLVPQTHMEGDHKLGIWVNGRRQAYRKGILSAEHIQLLESLPDWTWKPPKGPTKS